MSATAVTTKTVPPGPERSQQTNGPGARSRVRVEYDVVGGGTLSSLCAVHVHLPVLRSVEDIMAVQQYVFVHGFNARFSNEIRKKCTLLLRVLCRRIKNKSNLSVSVKKEKKKSQ